MKKKDNSDVLHCFPFGRSRCNPGRSKLPVDGEIVSVHGQSTVFSLPHAALASGLINKQLKNNGSLTWRALKEIAEKKWKKSVDKFFTDASKLNITQESIGLNLPGLKGAIIGWNIDQSFLNHNHFGICPDINITIAVLARRAGDLLIFDREPSYKWENLFDSCFGVDDAFITAPDMESLPWNQYKWG